MAQDLEFSRNETLGPFRPSGPPDDRPSDFWAAVGLAGAAMAAYASHKFLLKKYGYSYAESLYHGVRNVEKRSPAGMLSTFRQGEVFSSYAIKEASYAKEKIFEGGALTPLGEQLQRLIGSRVDFAEHFKNNQVLKFVRDERTVNPFLRLEGYDDVQVRFMQAGSITKTSNLYRSGKPAVRPVPQSRLPGLWDRLKANFHTRQSEQQIENIERRFAAIETFGQEEVEFFPVWSKLGSQEIESGIDTANRVAFDLLNRPMSLLASFGAGLRRGTYDSNLGLIGQLMLRRVAPVMVGTAALGYLDYLTDHTGRDTLAAVPVKADILRAELTDKLPFGRSVTDFYEQTVPGPQYGPLALPLGGAMVGGGLHYFQDVLFNPAFSTEGRRRKFRGDLFSAWEDVKQFTRSWDAELLEKAWSKIGKPTKGAVIGTALMLPFVPGMLGSRETADEKRDIYSGAVWEPVRAGRWWEMGATPWEGNRIVGYRPNWYAEMKSGAWYASTYGSEEAYWEHHPIISPLGYFDDPYFVERHNYADRPYPITSPAFSDVPLIGPILAGTIGKVVKPPMILHQGEYNEEEYRAFSGFVEPKGPEALSPLPPQEEYGLWDMTRREGEIFAEFIGLPGYVAKLAVGNVFSNPDQQDVYWQGSREMTSWSRQYYESEYGSMFGASFEGPTGMSEPLRRFIQRDPKTLHANEVPNLMPSWLPSGYDYPIDFHTGDPYVKLKFGHLRLPGPGYEALHPELQGVDPEDYPAITKLSILADVAPSSSQYFNAKGQVERLMEDTGDTGLRIQYEQILQRVEDVNRSTTPIDRRRFSGETEELFGTVEEATPQGVRLREYPGRVFQLSGVSMRAADLSSRILAENNEGLSRSEATEEVSSRLQQQNRFLEDTLSGHSVKVVVAKGAAATTQPRAVLFVDGENVNQTLIDSGLAAQDLNNAGPEYQAMGGPLSRTWGSISEEIAFAGDESALNPMRYLPNPAQTKLWQVREALEQYKNREIYGSKMRRWDRPFDDFISPYLGGVVNRTTGSAMMSQVNAEKRDLNTLTDILDYMRTQVLSGMDPSSRGRYTIQAQTTSMGANQFGTPDYLERTLPRSERPYLKSFLQETDPDRRAEILSTVSPELKRLLESQWAAQQAAIATAEGQFVPQLAENGRLVDPDLYEEYRSSGSRLDYGDWERSKEIAQFFDRRGLNLPDTNSPLWNPIVDYEDVKLKIIQNEGYDMHDFNVWEDRAALLWRKPYLDGAVRELTSGGGKKSEDELRRLIEEIMLKAKGSNRRPDVRVMSRATREEQNNINVRMSVDRSEELRRDARRNPEEYQ